MGALLKQARGGSERKLGPRVRVRLRRMFEEGVSAREAHRRIRSRHRVGYNAVRRERAEWVEESGKNRPDPVPAPTADPSPGEKHDGNEQSRAVLVSAALVRDVAVSSDEPATHITPEPAPERISGVDETAAMAHRATGASAVERSGGSVTALVASEVRGGETVQHAGTWLMIAMVAQIGLYAIVEQLWEGRKGLARLRIVIDAVVAALTLGQRCVEGVRRIATPTADVLLRADRAPTASWVRRVLGRFVAKVGGLRVHLALAGRLLREAQRPDDTATVFYVDNHLRSYTGKHTIRRGWRMQDKRVRPGVTDYWVHDEDGRPMLRLDVPSHDSLVQWLSPVAKLLRKALGDDERILLAFDRAGAYPEELAKLRNANVEFVTYERRPYALLTPSSFDRTVLIGKQEFGVHEQRMKNLGRGRGRVRRIVLRTPDGRQINLLASSSEPAERLIEIMVGAPVQGGGRWRQENAFKHGAERWGINQLDSRKVVAYDPNTIIPNPARRRLDRALRVARVREGDARNKLARYADDPARRERFDRDLAEALAQQQQLEAMRASTPTHAPLRDTELADKLVKHDNRYKAVIDSIRIACTNAETDLAVILARHLPRPKEAKKTLANLLAAPGDISVGRSRIRVALAPAATSVEHEAFTAMLATVNDWALTLPGDVRHRRLHFELRSQV
jgi:hypothetical protein